MTLDALQKTLDDQRVASNPSVSSWVGANAGSGKTRVLVNRVIRLLLNGTPPARILCLTFTKAAAAEMSNRIFDQLGKWSILSDNDLTKELRDIEGSDISPMRLSTARLLFAKALESPGGLKIQTIHAFCQSILGRFPLEAGVAPQFDVLDDFNQSVLLAQAQDEFLVFAESDSPWAGRASWQGIVAAIGEFALLELIQEISKERSILTQQTSDHKLPAAIARAWRALGFDEAVSPDDVIAEFHAAVARVELEEAANALESGSSTDKDRASAIKSVLKEKSSSAFWAAYQTIFLTQKGEARKSLATKSVREQSPRQAAFLVEEQQRVLGIRDREKSAMLGRLTETLLYVAQQIVQRYDRLKRLDGVLDYDDLIQKTADMLSRPGVAAWVLYKLDGGIDHILVDEAQDTNPMQWTVIQKLADEFFAGAGASEVDRTVFAVGDEKQSIYSFQGADPAEFDRQRRYFERKAADANKNWAPVELVLSFRSTTQILSSVDAVFESEQQRRQLTSAGADIKHEARRIGAAGRIELWPVFEPDDDDDDDPWDAPVDRLGRQSPPSRLAERIASTISSWLRDGDVLPSKGRPIRPSDIFILVRRRNRFVEELIRRLKIKNVPVAGVDRMILTDQIAVMDLMAAARFALLPDDDLTLAIVLRSPLADLTEEELFELAHGRDGTLWQALTEKAETEERFASARAILAEILSIADMVPPFEFFSRILNDMGARVRLVSRLGPDAQDPIDEFLAMALDFEQRETPSLQGFLDWIEQSNAEIKRDLDHGRNEVRIMTVHGAKGLEANIVFLPDTCGVPTAKHDARLFTVDSTDGSEKQTFWVPSSSFDSVLTAEARDQQRLARDAEFQRLLYVAMTRASDQLYVCGYKGGKKLPDACWYRKIEDALKDDASEVQLADGMRVWRIDGVQTAELELYEPITGDDGIAPWGQAFPDWVVRTAPKQDTGPISVSPSRLGGDQDEGPPVQSPVTAAREDRFKRGRLVHRLLELLPEVPADHRPDAARRFLEQPYLDVAADQVGPLVAETMGILEDTSFADIFGPGSRAEVPLVGQISIAGQSVPVNGQVDRLLVTDERVLVVDYKTNRPPPLRVEDVDRSYLRQMAVYRALLSELLPDRPVDCALLWTDGPRMMSLPKVLLDQAFAAIARA